ncbi:MAG TPA: helix-turn-helix transcriptional regulator [Sphingomicrobium sp.]|nr:helix-turn-helix transcriptional regulator [Sphingomicrobium sp.]
MSIDREVDASDAVALRIREELARRRLSRQWLADQSRVSLSTIEKALTGRRPFTLATVVRIEDALGTSLRSHSHEADAHPHIFAPESMGAYAHPGVQWLEGEYLTLRPSFSEPDAIFTYLTAIAWDDSRGHLVFSESGRQDREFEQKGFVSFPNLSGAIYLVTISGGQYRLALLNRPSGGGAISGILTTLAAGKGAQLIPAAVPLVLVPLASRADPELGVVRPGDRCYEDYRHCVDRVTGQGYALFAR